MIDMASAEHLDLCDCESYRFWYTGDDGTRWCRCGHAKAEHLAGRYSCTGEVEP